MSDVEAPAPVSQDKLDEFLDRFVCDFGAALHGATVVLGESLGLYKAIANAGPITSQELAEETGTNERHVREWLAAQAASGYVTFEPEMGRYSLSPEQRAALADESSPAYMPGAFQMAASLYQDCGKVAEAFRTGKGMGWHEHNQALFEGSDKFLRPRYVGSLTSSWLPALDGVEAKLESGARVADVGCGYGSSTILMAQAYPKSSFVGYDYHKPSIVRARENAARAGVTDRVRFDVSLAKEYPGRDYDLVMSFDNLHDMGDPSGVAKHVLRSLKTDGTWMIVEPFANDRLEHNLNPIGRMFYSASTMICTPTSLAQEVGLALGNQVGEARLREIVMDAGFGSFGLAVRTRFNRVFEVRP